MPNKPKKKDKVESKQNETNNKNITFTTLKDQYLKNISSKNNIDTPSKNLILNSSNNNCNTRELNLENKFLNNGKISSDKKREKLIKSKIAKLSNRKQINLSENLFLNFQNVSQMKGSSFIEISKDIENQNNINNRNCIADNSLSNSSQKEDIFLSKLDYLLNKIFNNFIETTNNQPQSSPSCLTRNTNNYTCKLTLSDCFREIFYGKGFMDLDDNFILKGTFNCDVKAMQNKKSLESEIFNNSKISNLDEKNTSQNMNRSILINKMDGKKEFLTIEVYFRKIIMPAGEIIEFYFNDISNISIVEKEKAENKIKSLVLAKISHEFKTPLITIIYILKNYISKEKSEKSDIEMDINNINCPIDIQFNGDKTLAKANTITKLKKSRNFNNIYEIQNNDETSNCNVVNKKKLNLASSIKNEEKYLNNIIDLSDYMLSLINDIIDFSVIDSSFEMKFQYDYFDIHKLLNFCFRILKILIDCKGLERFIQPIIEIDENVPQMFYSDEMRIKQVLLNLISNSIKFTRRGYIKIIAKAINVDTLEISIEDTGVGISAEDMKKLFMDFGKLRNKETAELNKMGSGLGLSICRKIGSKLGSQIHVESQQNVKTRFFFSIINKNLNKKKKKIKNYLITLSIILQVKMILILITKIHYILIWKIPRITYLILEMVLMKDLQYLKTQLIIIIIY